MKFPRPFLFLLCGLFVPGLAFPQCAVWLGSSSSFPTAKIVFSGNYPVKIKNGINHGLNQWNDLNEGADWPWFATGGGQVTIEVTYVDGFQNATGESQCGQYVGTQDGSSLPLRGEGASSLRAAIE